MSPLLAIATNIAPQPNVRCWGIATFVGARPKRGNRGLFFTAITLP